FAQVLCQAGDAGNGVADLVGDAGCEPTDAGQALGMHQSVLQYLRLGEVLDEQDQPAVARCQGLVDGGLVQVQPAGVAIQREALFVQVFVGLLGEVHQQASPRLADGGQA